MARTWEEAAQVWDKMPEFDFHIPRVYGPPTYEETEQQEPEAWQRVRNNANFTSPGPLLPPQPPPQRPVGVDLWNAMGKVMAEHPGGKLVRWEDGSRSYELPQEAITGYVKTDNPPPLRLYPTASPGGEVKARFKRDYPLTDQAAAELSQMRLRMLPDYLAEQEYPGAGGWYAGQNAEYPITLRWYPRNRTTPEWPAEALAHEFGHHWYDERLMPQEQQGFVYQMERPWNQNYAPPYPRPEQSPTALFAQTRVPEAQQTVSANIANSNDPLYGGQHQFYGTEMYAGLAGTMRGDVAANTPPHIRYYYQGLYNVPPTQPPTLWGWAPEGR